MPKLSQLLTGTAIAASVILPLAVSAQVTHRGMPNHKEAPPMHRVTGKGFIHKPLTNKNMVVGTVSTINGTTISLTGANSISYTIDASQAKFMGGFLGNPITLSNIQVGDKIMVNGPLNGAVMAATVIHDASLQARSVFNGTVTAISGTTVSLKDKNSSYTVEIGQAKLTKGFRGGTGISASDIHVGDKLMVGGTLNGTSITATTVNDIGKPVARGMHRGNWQGWKK